MTSQLSCRGRSAGICIPKSAMFLTLSAAEIGPFASFRHSRRCSECPTTGPWPSFAKAGRRTSCVAEERQRVGEREPGGEGEATAAHRPMLHGDGGGGKRRRAGPL